MGAVELVVMLVDIRIMFSQGNLRGVGRGSVHSTSAGRSPGSDGGRAGGVRSNSAGSGGRDGDGRVDDGRNAGRDLDDGKLGGRGTDGGGSSSEDGSETHFDCCGGFKGREVEVR